MVVYIKASMERVKMCLLWIETMVTQLPSHRLTVIETSDGLFDYMKSRVSDLSKQIPLCIVVLVIKFNRLCLLYWRDYMGSNGIMTV